MPLLLTAIKRELKNNSDYGQNQAEVRKQVEATQKRLSNLLDLYTDGNIDKKSYDLKSKQWQYELDELLVLQTKSAPEQSAGVGKRSACPGGAFNARSKKNKTPINYIERARDVFELSKNALEWYLQADYEKKRELLKLLHSNFLYDGSNPHYELNSVFKLLLDFSKNGKNVAKGT